MENDQCNIIDSLTKNRVLMYTPFSKKDDKSINATYHRENTFMIMNRCNKDDLLFQYFQKNMDNIVKYIDKSWPNNSDQIDWTNLDHKFYDVVHKTLPLAYVLETNGAEMLSLLDKEMVYGNCC